MADDQNQPSYDNDYRWYVNDSRASRLADSMTEQAGVYALLTDPLEEAQFVTDLTELIQGLLEDPARGSKHSPGQATDPHALDPARDFIDSFIKDREQRLRDERKRVEVALQKQEAARAQIEAAVPSLTPSWPSPLPSLRKVAHKAHVHHYRQLRSDECYSGTLGQMVEVCEQHCKCGAEREVVKKKTKLGSRVIRIRSVAPGTYGMAQGSLSDQ